MSSTVWVWNVKKAAAKIDHGLEDTGAISEIREHYREETQWGKKKSSSFGAAKVAQMH